MYKEVLRALRIYLKLKYHLLFLLFLSSDLHSHNFVGLSSALKDIPDLLHYQETKKDSLIKYNLTRFSHEWWNGFARNPMQKGIDLGLAYTCLYQRATSGITHNEAGGGDLDFFGLWTIFDENQDNPLFVGFSTEFCHKFTSIPPGFLGTAIGSLWQTVDGFDDSSYSLIELWADYHIIKNKLSLRVGKITLSDYFNLYSFINSNFNFLEEGLTNDFTIPFPESGLGFVIHYKPNKKNILLAAISDLNAEKERLSFDTCFEKKELFYSLGYYYLNQGNYNITLWYADSIQKFNLSSGYGCALSFEKEFKSGLVPFFRYGLSSHECTNIYQCLSFGFGIIEPFYRKDDQFGFGMVYGTPSWKSLHPQIAIETYYRIQLTEHLQITPDIEMIINPSQYPDKELIFVFGIRARFDI